MRARHLLAALITMCGVLAGTPANASAGAYVRCAATALQAAVAAANDAGGGTLNLAPRCTYRLTAPASGDNGLAVVTTPIRINGNRATITRSSPASFRFFQVDGAGGLTLHRVRLRGGQAQDGGAIFVNGGRLTLVDTTVTGNAANAIGGGIYSLGTVAVQGGIISDNTAVQGGGLNHQGVTATLDGTTVTGNRAVTGFAEALGGGILSAAPLTIYRGRIAGNESTGAGAAGAGVWNFDELAVRRTAVLGNEASGEEAAGGGLWNAGSATVTDTRFLFNTASGTGTGARGGAIFNATGTTTLTRVKVVANSATATGGGIFTAAGTVTRTRTLVADNKPDNCVPACA